MREDPLVKDQVYHVLSRSIAKYIIFNDQEDYARFMEILNLYRYKNFDYKYSVFARLDYTRQAAIVKRIQETVPEINIIAYCLMPTHFHLILKQVGDIEISAYISKVLNSYSRYFNIRHNRKGPLWEGRFKSVLVSTDEQLLHLTRYIHLNPVSAGLVNKPEKWLFSSYNEYLETSQLDICNFKDLIEVPPSEYKKFVEDRADFQKKLSLIKKSLNENYVG